MGTAPEAWKAYKTRVLDRLRQSPDLVYGGIQKQKALSNGWVQGLCPFHADTNPSFGYHRESLRWCCFVCGKGSVFDFLMATSGMDYKHTLLHWGDKLGEAPPAQKKAAARQGERPPIPEKLVARWQENLWKNDATVRWLREKRGLNDAILRKREIGWDPTRQRNTIPIRDERGAIGNVRLYNAKKKPKILNYTEGDWRYGSPARLYGVEQLLEQDGRMALLVEGEWDKLIGEQEGFLTVSSTHGCTVFRPEWVELFAGRDVAIVYDCDSEGQKAVHDLVIKAFRPAVLAGKVKSIRNVKLPLEGTKANKDLSDFFLTRGDAAAELQALIDLTPVHAYEDETKAEEIIEIASFTEIERKELIDKKVRCEITICGETSEAFHAVEEFEVSHCQKRSKGECCDCAGTITVPRGAREYIGSCMATDGQVCGLLRAFCCRFDQRVPIKILKRTTIKEFFCHQKVDRFSTSGQADSKDAQLLDGQNQELLEKRVYYLSSEHPKPGNYLATGWVKTHPRTQMVTFLIEELIPQEDDFQSFRTEEHLDDLCAFQRLSWSEIVEDLSENVTGIFEREDILTAVLLTYFSPLEFRFNNEHVHGWITAAIVGDSGSGKTQTYSRLSDFIGVGDAFSGLTGSRTGLAYALVEHKQKGWQIKIGRYPANSRKILLVDETQHLPEWDIRTISKAMTEGFLQVDRVKSKGYESKTRLIMVCNPHKDRIMDEYSFGCETLRHLFPPTIIRRLDFAAFANSGDIEDLGRINEKKQASGQGLISKAMLRSAIYWIWNLKPDQIVFSPEAEEYCLAQAGELGKVFGFATDVPLVPSSDIRKKLARLSAAFAGILLSTDPDFTQLRVERKHSAMAVEFLRRIYTHDNCGLDEFSEIARIGSQLPDYEQIKRMLLGTRSSGQFTATQEESFFSRAIYVLRVNERIPREDLAEQIGASTKTISRIVRKLKQFNLLDSHKGGYRKKPKFNKFLKRFLREPEGKDYFQRALKNTDCEEESEC